MIHRCLWIRHGRYHAVPGVNRITDLFPVLVCCLRLDLPVDDVGNKGGIHIRHDRSILHGIACFRAVFQKIGIVDQPAHRPVYRLAISVMLHMNEHRLHFHTVILDSVYITRD